VILPATAIFGGVLLSTGIWSDNIWRFYFFYLALGILVSGVGPVPYGNVISHWFDRQRGLALGLMMFWNGWRSSDHAFLRATADRKAWLAHGVCRLRLRSSAYFYANSYSTSKKPAAGSGSHAGRCIPPRTRQLPARLEPRVCPEMMSGIVERFGLWCVHFFWSERVFRAVSFTWLQCLPTMDHMSRLLHWGVRFWEPRSS
jgi:hypothetical protein